jgi:hypothetical protein
MNTRTITTQALQLNIKAGVTKDDRRNGGRTKGYEAVTTANPSEFPMMTK